MPENRRGPTLRDELPASAEVVVVGGGVIGAACCHALAEAGLSTALLESRELGGGASGACEGNVLASDKRPGPEFELARRSIGLYPGLAERLDADIELERKGSLLVALTDEAHQELARETQLMRAGGLQVELLDPAAATEAEPALCPELSGAALVADDMQLSPLHLVLALALACARLGAHVIQGCEVEEVELAGDRVAGVKTRRGRIASSSVVVAAGVGTRRLTSQLGFDLPLVGRRGQVLVSVPSPGLIRRKVYDFGYRATIEARGAGVEVATVLETTRRGNLLVGASREFRDTLGEPDIEVDALLAARALELAPGLAGLRILRSYAGVRPTLADGLPAIGPVEGIEGLWLACGHEGAGIGLAPGTAEMLTALITDRPTPVPAQTFSPSRFDQPIERPAGRGFG
jgi:D-hydroxyproline dehydrogenase subunit beta